MIDKSGEHWRGDDVDDLAECVREFAAGRYPVEHVRPLVCAGCGGTTFEVLIDVEEGCAATTCVTCQAQAAVADSEDYLDDADLEECACPCGGEMFSAVVGFAMTESGEVRWISLGLRCVADGVLGVYTDWKIDYEPSRHLLTV
jgi:hypothetical protein